MCVVRLASCSANARARRESAVSWGAGQRGVAHVANPLVGNVGGQQADPLGVAAADEIAKTSANKHPLQVRQA